MDARMAGLRYPNYFPDSLNGSAFNRYKYKTYYSYLNVAGIINALKRKYG